MELTEIIRPDLLGMKPYSSARDEYEGDASLFLDANENPFNNGVNRYPDPLQKNLKKRIAEIKGVRPEQIFLGNGSDECIDLLFRLLCRPGIDKAASISPSYGMYAVSARINQIELVDILLNEDFSLDVDRVIEKASGCKLLFLCSPNNPTGQSFPKVQVLEIVKRFNGIVVLDEAYVDFSNELSFLTELDNFPNLAVSQTFSKAYGMAGVRLGMLFGSEELINWINKIKPPYNINQLTQEFVLQKLSDPAKVQKEISIIRSEREKLLTDLDKLDQILVVYPSDSNFILVKVKDANDLYNYLINNGVVVRNRSNQPLCSNTLRLTVGTPDENQKLLQLIRNY
ncbi:MAG: histidinol-phosphate transaminase [Flavobacteriia bacterium]|jgi:histidinol-phosphate aminotransferase